MTDKGNPRTSVAGKCLVDVDKLVQDFKDSLPAATAIIGGIALSGSSTWQEWGKGCPHFLLKEERDDQD